MDSGDNTRNFSIIAHIDHGKSTLADRLIESTQSIPQRKMRPQFLDKMDIERERGITIKAQPIRLNYFSSDGKNYIYNLIDTPGHVDFSYEVSRSLAACEGAVLLVDASQGLEAQTFSNMFMAFNQGLDIIPVINKIDLSNARVEEVKKELKDAFGFRSEEIIRISAKTGQNIPDLLEAIKERIKPPVSTCGIPRALIFDAQYEQYRGVILHIRVFDGEFEKGKKIILNSSKGIYEILELGVFKERMYEKEMLKAGEVGYIVAGIRDLKEVFIGDTVFRKGDEHGLPVQGFLKIKPMVYAGLYPAQNEDYEKLKRSLEKIVLNDSSLIYEHEASNFLGFGFRVGFLGLLHMEIVSERLSREFETDAVLTAPSVQYKVKKKDGTELLVNDTEQFPDPAQIEEVLEPFVEATIISFINYVDILIRLIEEKRGTLTQKTEYIGDNRIILHFTIPLSEIISNFFDKMKSATKGYSSLDYGNPVYKVSDIIKVEILLNGKPVPAFSFLTERSKAERRAREIIEKLKEEIPRHLFVIKIQSAISSKIIASVQVSALRKDVLAKCYGGDITRKRKLLEKQKEGKKKMRSIGNINVPKSAFLNILKID